MSYERIGDTKYVDGKKFTLIAQTESHKQVVEKNSVPGTSKLHPALRKPRWEIDNDTIEKYKWKIAQEKEKENLKKNVNFLFTMDNYENYANAIMYLQENLGTVVTGEYDIRTAQFIFSLLKEKYKEISPYLKYHGTFGYAHVYGIDENLWDLLKLNPKALAPDDDIVWVSGTIRIQSEEYKKHLPIDAVPVISEKESYSSTFKEALGEWISNIDFSLIAAGIAARFGIQIPEIVTASAQLLPALLEFVPDSSKREIYSLKLFQEFKEDQRVPVCVGYRSSYVNLEDVTDDYSLYP